MKKSDTVIENAGIKIGSIGTSEENGGFAEHLHFGFTTSSDMKVWLPVGPRYKNSPEWRNGKDLDYIADPYIDSNGILTVYAYTLNDGNSGVNFQECEKVELWYRIGSGSWTFRGMNAVGNIDKQ